jgi:uncharacterized protein YecT (DUF1311 family)
MKNTISVFHLQKHCLILLCLFVCSAVVIINAAHAATTSAGWLLSYAGKSSNAFIWDKRTKALIKDSVPAKMAADLLAGLGGPPEPVHVLDQRYFSASACVAHACMDKGFFWFDTQTGAAVGAYLSERALLLGSKRLSSQTLPLFARQAIIAWLAENDIQPETVSFLSGNGQSNSLAPGDFLATQKYRASPQGPSFDCAKARSGVEHAICDDAMLAKQDLELAKLVSEIRHGHDTVEAQDQLRAMQRKWLKERDMTCQNIAALSACLSEQYHQQQEKLMHWVPTH